MSRKMQRSGGIIDVDRYLKEQERNGRKLFKLVTEETGDIWTIKSLATRESLFALIDYTIDFALRLKSVGRGVHSRKTAIIASERDNQILFKWFDDNLHKYKKNNQAVYAVIEMGIVNKSESTVRKKLTEYKKLKKAVSN